MKTLEILSADRTIIMSSAFEKKARKFGSPEYKMLQEARRDNPGYAEVIRQFKTNTKQDRYQLLFLLHKYCMHHLPPLMTHNVQMPDTHKKQTAQLDFDISHK